MTYDEAAIKYDQASTLYDPESGGRSPAGGGEVIDPTAAMAAASGEVNRMYLSLTSTFSESYLVSLIDPLQFRDECIEHDVPLDPWYGKCNSFTCPLGPEPSVAYLLVTYGQVIKLYESVLATTTPALYALAMSVQLVDASGVARNANHLYVTEWRCVSGGRIKDDNAVYMITLKDYRAGPNQLTIANNDYPLSAMGIFGSITNAAGCFNMPRLTMHAKDGGTAVTYFMKSSLYPSNYLDSFSASYRPDQTDTTLWTWAQMLTAVGANTVFGQNNSLPLTMPYTPASNPVNWDLQLCSAGMAIHAILDRLSLAVRFDPFNIQGQNGTPLPTMVIVGQTDTARDLALSSIGNYLLWDANAFCAENSQRYVYFNVKYIPLDYAGGVGPAAFANGWLSRYTGVLYYSQFDMDPRAKWGTQAIYNYGFNTLDKASLAYWRVDHDVPFWNNAPGYFTQSQQNAFMLEHFNFYSQSVLATRQINRIYSGYHTQDALLPGSMMKIVRWEDTGKGPRTHFYCGDNYLPPHALYHLVNPHRYHRSDDMRRFRTIDQIDLTKL